MTKATISFPVRRAILVSGFAAAIVISPVIAAFTSPDAPVGTPTAACPLGQNEDPYTFACVPNLAPNGGDSTVGAPSETELTQCSGRDQGECLEGDLYPPAPVPQPDTTVQQSP